MKYVITVVGKDKVGIISGVCTYLSENNINILDISQTILKEYFNMIMIVEVPENGIKSSDLSKQLAEVGKKIGVDIEVRNEAIFDSMHRI